jgi:transitional endoplasmic reticulum ATPase
MNETIKNLEEALAVSPDNIPLRLHLAELMLAAERYPDAAGHFELVLQKSYGNVKARAGLATCYYHTGKFSAAIIIYEQLQNQLSEVDNLRFVKCLIREGSMQEAGAVYQKIIQANPNFSDPDIDSYLRVASQQTSTADEQEEMASGDEPPYFMEKPAINFSAVGGMQRIKNEISLKIIQPLKNPELYKAFGKKAGGGILLYGPPGCGNNAPWSVDAAFRRPGRFDRVIFVEPPDEKSREQILRTALTGKPTGEIDLKKLVAATPEYSGADLMAVIDIAIEDKLTASMEIGVIQPISTKDLLKAVKAHRPTTGEWFATARNYALYANDTGLYDDILKYMKIKK